LNLEAEWLTRAINDTDNLNKTAIKPGDLENPAFQAAHAGLIKLLSSGFKPDLMTIVTECREYAVELTKSLNCIEKANFEYYDRELSKEIQRRRLRVASTSFMEYLDNGSSNQDIVARVEELISASNVEHDHREIKSLYQCALEFGPILEERVNLKGELVGIQTGFPQLDDITGGFQPGTYYIGARPSQGKTALMLSMMRAALRSGRGAGLISIESSDIELISRVLSAEGPVPAANLKKGSMVGHEYNALRDSLTRLEGWNGQVYFNTKTDTSTLEAVSRRMIETFGVEIIFIDYLQRVNAKGGTKFEQVANASRIVTDIAKGMGVPVVCLAQTGRIADHEQPSLNHFQYSSAIEQDADIAMIINHYIDDEKKDRSQLCVLKNRDGEVKDIPVYFDRKHVRFVERCQ